jgi:hypothetical protein
MKNENQSADNINPNKKKFFRYTIYLFMFIWFTAFLNMGNISDEYK